MTEAAGWHFGFFSLFQTFDNPNHAMVLTTPHACSAADLVGPDSILKVGEFEVCEHATNECSSLLESLNALRSAHAAAGVDQGSLQMVELYNTALAHLDAARDRLHEIMCR
jgi:hypothetical protein